MSIILAFPDPAQPSDVGKTATKYCCLKCGYDCSGLVTNGDPDIEWQVSLDKVQFCAYNLFISPNCGMTYRNIIEEIPLQSEPVGPQLEMMPRPFENEFASCPSMESIVSRKRKRV
jgi:hypothetical protein